MTWKIGKLLYFCMGLYDYPPYNNAVLYCLFVAIENLIINLTKVEPKVIQSLYDICEFYFYGLKQLAS